MDKIEFKVENIKANGFQYKSVRIFVNDIDIIDLLKELELTFTGSKDIAGSYEGLSPDTLYKHLTNPDKYDIDENGKVAILDCKCGGLGCWPMKIKISYFDNQVIWKEFEQPHRSSRSNNFWNYSKFGPFTFDQIEYSQQLEKLKG
ncbi:MAG TPA: hypothetical protein VEC36_12815 [Patescibacteria group bacterium]|nr:hypothetical protein [Patescibacteria group bacterium]